MRNNLFFHFFLFLLALLGFSCSTSQKLLKLEQGKSYLVSYNNQQFIIIPTDSGQTILADAYQINNQNLFLEKQSITITQKSKKWKIESQMGRASVIPQIEIIENNEFVLYPDLYRNHICEDISKKTDIYADSITGFWKSKPFQKDANLNSFLVGELIQVLSINKLNLDMDIYYHRNDTIFHKRPLLVLIHGGAFFVGDKADIGIANMCRHFAGMGYVTASVNYRMGFWGNPNSIERAGYQAIQDVHAAIRKLVANAETYNINPQLIFVGGSSAGAITALNVAFMENKDRPQSTHEIKGDIKSLKPIEFFNNLNKFRDEPLYKKVVQGIKDLAKATLHWVVGNSTDLIYFFKPEVEQYMKSDLGNIESVGKYKNQKFDIKAVVNMWGAVSDIKLLDNSKYNPTNLSIISFHSKNDPVVPYDYSLPFKVWNGKNLTPINSALFSPMYGSSKIHERFVEKGFNSSLVDNFEEGLHTIWQTGNSQLNENYKYIIDTTTSFLYRVIVPQEIVIQQNADNVHHFIIENSEIKNLTWKVENGLIYRTETNGIYLGFYNRSASNKITASGNYRNGAAFIVEKQF